LQCPDHSIFVEGRFEVYQIVEIPEIVFLEVIGDRNSFTSSLASGLVGRSSRPNCTSAKGTSVLSSRGKDKLG
jgi:hypothetical protein